LTTGARVLPDVATLVGIRVHPIKALDPVERECTVVSPVGGLDGDRAYAIVDADGEYVNGKRTDAVHRLRSDVDLDAGLVRLGERGSEALEAFHLPEHRARLADWLSAYFGLDVDVESAPGGELTDSAVLGGDPPGATVVSTATLETVASWFPGLDIEDVRRRFRANLEVEGVPAFWEDGLVADGGVRFLIGDVAFQAVEPVPRCVVPTRDPDTGEVTDGFRERFIRKRESTLPADADPAVFEHPNVLTVLAEPDADDRGEAIAVGDSVELLD